MGASDNVFLSVVTVSELLMGVHRADSETRRKRRSEFVEAVLARVSVLDFTTAVARRHAGLYAELARQGKLIGAHDMIIAATALHHRLSLLTDNVAEFSRVPDLSVVRFGALMTFCSMDRPLARDMSTRPATQLLMVWVLAVTVGCADLRPPHGRFRSVSGGQQAHIHRLWSRSRRLDRGEAFGHAFRPQGNR